MKRHLIFYRTVCVAIALIASLGVVEIANAKGRASAGVIYVTSQHLYFDSFVTANRLPPKGRFQKLEVVDGQAQTEFGPGDQDYVGGRWWVDANGDGVMNEGDRYFLCPLLGPGRENP